MNLESGFLFLPDCEISLFPRQEESKHSESFCGSWLSLSIPSFDACHGADAMESSTGGSSYDLDSCQHCCLTVDCHDSSASFSLLEPTPRFDGHLADMKPCKGLCTCQEPLRQRSDGALLVGLVLRCQELGHVQVQSIEVMLKPNLAVVSPEDTAPSSALPTELSHHSRRNSRAALAITIHIPEVQMSLGRNTIHGKSSRRRFISSSPKPLPPATQLLLSILRTDWTYLEYCRVHPQLLYQSPAENARQEPLSFFPHSLALDEVYIRIGGATDPVRGGSITNQPSSPATPDAITCYDLPRDIWQYHIGAFLKAKSLDALRCSNPHFHRMLQAVVPGLKLRLYAHQVNALSWMRQREVRRITENDILSLPKSRSEGDIHSAVTGGATVLLRSRDGVHTIRIAQNTGEEVKPRVDDPLSRTVARGGLLCDDPGLGKTITVLSLVLQTLGLSTVQISRTDNEGDEQVNRDDEDDTYEEQIFREYWREQSIPSFRAQALNKFISTFIRANHPDIAPFMYPIEPERDGVPDYYDIIARPICLQDIRKRIDRFHYDPEFKSFQADVLLCFQNALAYHPPQSGIHLMATLLKKRFLDAIAGFKDQQVNSAKKSFSKATSKPNSSVAALVEKNHRVRLQNALVQSSGTLLVVPSVLLEHWEDQIRLHVDLKFCTNSIPVRFEFTGSPDNNLLLEELVRKCDVDKTHMLFLFIDKSGVRKLPSPQLLSKFTLVITTNQRFTNEWKNGSYEQELRLREAGCLGTYESEVDYDLRSSFAQSEEACSLLKVNWLRMIVDEGHSMGRGTKNSAISFASWISAERRWAMTGTPTRNIISHSGLTDLSNLMKYLQHEFFSRRCDGDSVWKHLITHGWNRGMMSSFFRLKGLLALLMVRHTKRDIVELPVPQYHSRSMPMGTEEVRTYNTLVCAIQSNLLITSMKGRTSGLQDSLLHRSQGKHARKALQNVRLVCAGGTRVIPTITNLYWAEFLRDFEQCSADPKLIRKMERYLSRATTEQVSPCDCCGTLLTTLLVVPCGDLVCTECFDPKSNSCVVCDQTFDVDVFQKLQPGMDYQWLHNIEEEAKKRKSTVHLLPTGDHRDGTEAIVLDDARGVLAIPDNFGDRRRAAKPGDGHKCEYSARREDGQCELCWTEHDYCNLLTPSGRCQVCYRAKQSCPEFETKPSFVVGKLVSLYQVQQKRESCPAFKTTHEYPDVERRPLKVIVFSQFRNVLNTIGDRLIRRCGTACIAEYWGSNRKKALHQFAKDIQCFCMLVGKDGSEGLDLSFVTNMIFLEQVYDKSLEEQVVARAWRMGAKGPVEVETLVAKDSVEELMARLDSDLKRGLQTTEIQGIRSATEKGKGSEYQSAKLHFLLMNLRLITRPDTNPLTAGPGGQAKGLLHLATDPAGPSGEVKAGKQQRVRFHDGTDVDIILNSS